MFDRKSYNREYRRKNPEKVKRWEREWRKRNPEKMLIYLERARKNYQRQYLKHKESKLRRAKEYSKTPQSLWNRTKINAVKRGYEFLLTFEEFVQITSNPCIYCHTTQLRIGIDRADNKEGYTKDNSKPCCRPCNIMKNKLSYDEFLQKIKTIYENHLSSSK